MKRIQIKKYPATFEFKIRTELPEFDNHAWEDDDGYQTQEQWENRKNHKAEEIRQKLLLKYLKKLKVYSFGHGYEDYVVERVTVTEDGEIWQLGS